MSRLFLSLTVCLLLNACGNGSPPPETAAAPPPQKTVIDTQLQALEKAKAVQDVVDKQAADAKKQIDDAGG